MADLLITPQTRVAQLLDAYPQLEPILLELSSAFVKLRNPLLRRTVARIATLQQAAQVGNVEVGTMINRFRAAVGQDPLDGLSATTYNRERPTWFAEDRVAGTTEIAALLDRGEQPVHVVIGELQRLAPGSIHAVIAPFLPAPLLDKTKGLGIEHWVAERNETKTVVYFCRVTR
ncbi:MAG: DUF1858 domain-containing protein [Acidobacteria bacterium]|nr:DUF1858 domain-containing protein [Acidobacteriota bacterium]